MGNTPAAQSFTLAMIQSRIHNSLLGISDISFMRLMIVLGLLISSCVHAQTPSDISGLALWLDANNGVVVNENNRVDLWEDQSGNENHASQSVANFRPFREENVLNGLPVVRFDGENDYIEFAEISDIRSVFWVLRQDESTASDRVPLLCHGSEFDFHRGSDFLIWHPEFTNANVREGVTRLNQNDVDGVQTALPNQYCLVSLVTTGAVTAERFSFDRSFGDRMWKGELLELIVYNEPLTETQRSQVEGYLLDKYSPDLNVTDDVTVDYGYCPVEISANPGFESYLWSTGEESMTIEVNNSGAYWVEVTDVFGRIQTDTVTVAFPGNTQQQSPETICAGDSTSWDLQIPEEDYEIQWLKDDEPTDNWFKEEGTYSALIEDTDGCTLTTPLFELSVDSFALVGTLGPDLELCAGNTVEINGVGTDDATVIWNETVTAENYVVTESEQLTVEAVNLNGCVLNDTINIEVIGIAPDVQILVPPLLCEGAPAQLQGSASAPGITIDAWEWQLPNTDLLNEQSVEWIPAEAGAATLELTVLTSDGCEGNAELNMPIYPRPQGTISVEGNCEDDEVHFSATGEISSGLIQDFSWLFAAEAADGNMATFIPENPGFEEVQLTLTSDAGCVNTISQLVNILPAPIPVISVNDGCLGDQTEFNASVESNGSGLVSSTTWFFGDGGSSSQLNTSHLYAAPATYTPVLQVIAQNGCRGLASEEVAVFEAPDADFAVSDACLETPFTLSSESIEVAGDPIVDWQWQIQDAEDVVGESVAVAWTSTGFKEVVLTVTSATGCSDTREQNVVVHELPEADFTFDPVIGAPPLEVTFTNTSVNAVSADWSFGDMASSGDFSPSHTYTNEGSFEAILVVTNVFGCQDTARQFIDVTEPATDLRLEALFVTEISSGVQMTAQVVNAGNYTVNQMVFTLQQGNGSALTEMNIEALAPGEVLNFTFSSMLEQSAQLDPWICAEVQAVSPVSAEMTPENNSACVALSGNRESLRVFPNPVNTGDDLRLRFRLLESEMVVFSVIDASGREVYRTEETRAEAGFNEWSVPTAPLESGMYTLQLNSRHQTQKVRFQVR